MQLDSSLTLRPLRYHRLPPASAQSRLAISESRRRRSDGYEARVFPKAQYATSVPRAPIDFGWVHRELRRTAVTLQLLWSEYVQATQHGGGQEPYQYSQFCALYLQWRSKLDLVMRQVHRAGEEKLGLVVDREWSDRDNRRIARRLKEAKLGVGASLEAIDCDATRGLDKALVRQLMTCQWAKQKQNVIITGATGTGKSFVASALAEAVCRQGMRAFFVRVPRIVEELAVARV